MLGADIIIPGRFDIEPDAKNRGRNSQLGTFKVGPGQPSTGREDKKVNQRHRQPQRQLTTGTPQRIEVPDCEAWIGDLNSFHDIGARQAEPGIFLLQPRAAQHGDPNGALGRHRLTEPFRNQRFIGAAAVLLPPQLRRAARGQ
nr:hypothetical protein [Polymorphobacter multimanifer]